MLQPENIIQIESFKFVQKYYSTEGSSKPCLKNTETISTLIQKEITTKVRNRNG